jgi:pyrimidine-nucleoside phosphorylase/thymidine phosphorylase
MKRRQDAERLARVLAGIGRSMGKRVVALLTAMDQPLGSAVGNALEVAEAVELLRGGGPADLRQVTFALCAEMLLLAGLAHGADEALARVGAAVASGSALAKLREIVAAQGGDPRAIDDLGRLPRAARTREVPAPVAGVVQGLDAEAIGLAAMALGAGRTRVEDAVDPAAGILLCKKVGDRVGRGEPLAVLHCGDRGAEPPEAVAERVARAWRIGEAPAAPGPLILERIG